MRCRPFDSISCILVTIGTSGCVDSMQVGLSNAHAMQWHQAILIDGSNAVANADDSCERVSSGRPDPAPIRFYRCPGQMPEGTRVLGTTQYPARATTERSDSVPMGY